MFVYSEETKLSSKYSSKETLVTCFLKPLCCLYSWPEGMLQNLVVKFGFVVLLYDCVATHEPKCI